MNPTAVTQPRPPAMPDAASPAAASTTNIVDNIPMHAPAQPAVAAPNEDAELDTIMQDIGHELKQADRQTTKKHFSLFSRKPKVRSQPAAVSKIMDVSAARPPASPPAPAALPSAAPAVVSPQPPKTGSAPAGIIFMTILVTGALIAAAIYSYK